MAYRLIEAGETLRGYRAPTVKLECRRCRRDAPDVDAFALRRRFGDELPIVEIARRVAASSARPCGLAAGDGTGPCSAQAWEPPVWLWATLYDAFHGGWRAVLHCQRHHAALKAAKPCAQPVELDIASIAAVLGHDFKLERLPAKCECPRCHTNSLEIEWILPPPAAPPHAPAASAPPLRFKPSPGVAAQRVLRVVGRR